MNETLNAQQHWEKTFSQTIDMFGTQSSEPAKIAVDLFKQEGKKRILNWVEAKAGILSSSPATVFDWMSSIIPNRRS